jgi:hypothetical protein
MTFFFKRHFYCLILIMTLLSCVPPASREYQQGQWPAISREMKPWTRWWWQGSALTKEAITAEMEAYHAAGIGGLEITPIYGVYGEEDHFTKYLSPEWMALLMYVFKEAQRLDMGIDMATGTGWPFGGPWVTNDDACKTMRYKTYEVNGDTRLAERITFIQEPYLRMVGNHIYVPDSSQKHGKITGTAAELIPAIKTRNTKITDLADPIGKNENLQALAIDQVQFQKPLPLVCLMAYGNDNQILDLTSKVDAQGKLDWTAPAGTWKLYAVFEGFHGKMVERAGPGGEGNVIDHFSPTAVNNYLAHFDEAFKGHDISPLRAFFNDSYEVDDARGSADFTPTLFEEFSKRRGYDLRNELPALFGKDDKEKNERVLCDYRETISELLLEHFTTAWRNWAHKHDAVVRNQAHGSPANILDLYAVVDIPEIEGTEPLRFKMATSSGNVTGKRLISAESATWLNEHFTSNLADVKAALDKYLLQGVNHLVYHGTCYSPPGEPWPGRLFYAAIHMNPRNPLWRDADALNAYIARCQSLLQRTRPDNDILLYYPLYDRFSTPGRDMIEHFDGIGRAFEGSSFAKAAELMLSKGWAFDYISDKQFQETIVDDGLLRTSGGSLYRTIVVPACNYMPMETLEKIMSLAGAGARIVFIDHLPTEPSGYHDLDTKRERFGAIIDKINEALADRNSANPSLIQLGTDLAPMLANIGIERESMEDMGLHCLRKQNSDGGSVYFVNNPGKKTYEGWLPIRSQVTGIVLYDPMTGESGNGKVRKSSTGSEVYVRLNPSESLILEGAAGHLDMQDFPYIDIAGKPFHVSGKWKVTFESGGPTVPPSIETDSLNYWTTGGEAYQNFSGTAVYALSFKRPSMESKRWLLQVDSVRESAEVFLNGKPAGTMIGPCFELVFDGQLLKEQNLLEIKVSNLMANRIAWMDRNHIFWKKFYNVNFPARRRENSKNGLFDASEWKPKPSGIWGKVEMYPLR